MNPAVITAACTTVLAFFFFLIEGDGLAEGHARVRTQILNTARWAIVIGLSWILIPAALAQPDDQRAATILGMAALIGAVMLIPVSWFVRLGGLERTWELRRARVEVAHLANRTRRSPGAVQAGRLQEAIDRIVALRTPYTAELCDLLVAQLNDLRAGAESWTEAGRRSIRIYELGRSTWPENMPIPDFDPDEATFRWHLYRLFGLMMEIGQIDNPSLGKRKKFRALTIAMDEFRREDTYRFIDAVQQSADRWLARPVGRPWIASYGFESLGPDGLTEVRKIWGRDAAMWGADLDDDDRRAIKEDLARRARATEPNPEPNPEPTAAHEPSAAAANKAG
jgi:hypothetical protein